MSALASAPRRRFLVSSLLAGAWTLSAGSMFADAANAAEAKPPGAKSPFDFWLRFDVDGSVTAFTTVTNLGQGSHTAIAQIVAEELEMPLTAVRVAHAPVIAAFHREFPPGITTFASAGLATAQDSIAPACAAARDMLIRAAAMAWRVDAGACRALDGRVVHTATARASPYRDLLANASRLKPPDKPAVKSHKDWKILGKPVPREDIPARVDGSAVFGIDVKRDGMLVATVIHAPGFGGVLQSVDETPALRVKGVHKVVRLPGAVAVVADGYWPAHKAALLLEPVWKSSEHVLPNTEEQRTALHAAAQAGHGLEFPSDKRNSARQDAHATALAIQNAAHVIDTTYEVPFLAHAAMEPLNATVAVHADGADIWLSTQSQTDTQRAVAAALGLKTEQVTVHSQNVGGGFGRRLEHDFAVEAALIAQAAGAPVKTIWSRENDMRAGYYRPINATRVRLALDAQHAPLALRADMAGPSLLEYSGVTNGPPIKGFDWSYTMGWISSSYNIPKFDTRWTRVDHGVPCGYWRSVGNSQNCYFMEHTIDQAARASGVDALDYRRRLLVGKPRMLNFIDCAAEHGRWSNALPKNHFRGFALNQSNNTISAHIVEIACPEPGKFQLVRIAAVIDPGVVANPKSVEAQMMGGTLFGLSAALYGEITFENGAVEQGNYDTYRVVKLAQTPPLDVLVLSSGNDAFGVGEEGPSSIMAALANALLAASGKPILRLPLTRSGWELMA